MDFEDILVYQFQDNLKTPESFKVNYKPFIVQLIYSSGYFRLGFIY